MIPKFRNVRARLSRYWRYAQLRLRGYHLANPDFKDYGKSSERRTRRALEEILARIGVQRFRVVLEHGCGTRTRTTPAIKHFADEVWGVDVLPREEISGSERYILVDFKQTDLLPEIDDGGLDAIIIINYTGFHPHSTWRTYFSPANDRLSPYLQRQNFPRILRPGGYLIACEWEAMPEARWHKASITEANVRAAEVYDAPANVPYFDFICCGFSRPLLSSYIVYRRTFQ